MKRLINFSTKLICFLLILVFLNAYQVQARNKAEIEAANKAEIEEAEAHNREVLDKMAADQGLEQKGAYKDGTYQGKGQGYGGTVEISLTVEKGYVTEIIVVSSKDEDPVYMDQAVSLLDQMIKMQSNDVDTVSGATFSSIGIIEAVGDALGKAV